jgi:hypothetical protein
MLPSILWTLCDPVLCPCRHFLPGWISSWWLFLHIEELLAAAGKYPALKCPKVVYRMLSSLDLEVAMPDQILLQPIVHWMCDWDIRGLGEHNVPVRQLAAGCELIQYLSHAATKWTTVWSMFRCAVWLTLPSKTYGSSKWLLKLLSISFTLR